MRPITSRTTTDRTVLSRELDGIRKRGWALTVGENSEGATALAAPIKGPHGLLLAVSIAGPEVRLPRRKLLTFVDDLIRAAKMIERTLSLGNSDGK
jgi:DNA-binding IclR family transcriptional regulator